MLYIIALSYIIDSLDHQKKKFHIHQIKTVLSAGEKEKKHMMEEDMALLNFLFRENKRRLRELYGECEVKTQKTEGFFSYIAT